MFTAMKKTILFFVLFILTLCSIHCAQDPASNNSASATGFRDAIKYFLTDENQIHVESGKGYYFVGTPCVKNDVSFIFVPVSQFESEQSKEIKLRDVKTLTMYLFVYNQKEDSRFMIQVVLSDKIEKSIKVAMKDDRSNRIGTTDNKNAYEKVETCQFLYCKDNASRKNGILLPQDPDLSTFLTDITQWFEARDLPTDENVKIIIYGDDLKNYKIAYFKKDNPDGWIGCKKQASKCYCKNTEIKNFEENLSATEDISNYSLIAVGSNKIAYLTQDGVLYKYKYNNRVVGGSKKWTKDSVKDFYEKYPYLLKDEAANSNLLKEIAISLVDSEYWVEIFRQNPVVPYTIYAK